MAVGCSSLLLGAKHAGPRAQRGGERRQESVLAFAELERTHH